MGKWSDNMENLRNNGSHRHWFRCPTCRFRTHHSGIDSLRPEQGNEGSFCEKFWEILMGNLVYSMFLRIEILRTSSSKNLHFSQKYFPMQTPQDSQYC